MSPPEAAAARTTRARRLRTPGLRGLGETDEGFVAREDVDAPPSPPRPKAPGRSRGVPGETRARADAAGIADAAGDMASTSFSGPALRESDVVHPPHVFKSRPIRRQPCREFANFHSEARFFPRGHLCVARGSRARRHAC